MSKAATFSESEIALMVLVLKHVEAGKSNFHVIQKEFNLPTLESASKRWQRLNAKLKKLAGIPKASESRQKSSSSKKTAEKRKRAIGDDDDEAVKEATPRKKPVRNSRGKKLKAEGYDEAVEFEDSGYGEMDSEAGRSVDEYV